jgi:peptidoglycan/xylan/chitin deacetylase (PgdA/CDA1 family)/GNAT superfamily N-acetyltransferase
VASPAYLTFDDGPDPGGTPQVLEALARSGVPATFFVLGSRVVADPRPLETALEAGHRVELHAHEHVSHERMERGEIERDVERALGVLDRFGVRPTRWRPPFGAVTEASFAIAADHGLELTAWTTDPRDWEGGDAASMLSSVDRMLGPQSVVLLHDGILRDHARRDVGGTLSLIDPLAERLRATGCEPAVLPPGGEGRAPLAAAGFAPGPWSRGRVEFRIVEEADVDNALRERLGEFIADLYEANGAPYRGRAWRTIPPVARVLAFAGDSLIGHNAVFFPRAVSPVRVAGIGDLAVARPWRRRGIARSLIRHVVFQGWRRGAQAELTATEAVRTTFAELGFEPVEDFGFHWDDGVACRRDPSWMAATAVPIAEPVRLLDPDF